MGYRMFYTFDFLKLQFLQVITLRKQVLNFILQASFAYNSRKIISWAYNINKMILEDLLPTSHYQPG